MNHSLPRMAYIADGNLQHVFPIEAMLRVLPAPVFTNGERLAQRLRCQAEVVIASPQELPAIIASRDIDILFSTSQVLSPPLLRRARPSLKVVFLGHGESDKTEPRPFQEQYDEFDLLAIARQDFYHTLANPHKELVGSLKHDLFLARGYDRQQPEPAHVLWAPGWGRHNAVSSRLQEVVDATHALGLTCLLHLHPYSYEAEPHVVRLAQVEVLRHRHFRLVQTGDILKVMSRCALMLGDVSSVCYDWLLFDRPILFLNHPGLSLAEEKHLFAAGRVVGDGDSLCEALREELSNPAAQQSVRRAALARCFLALDGQAAQRVVDAIMRRWWDNWVWGSSTHGPGSISRGGG